MKRYENGELFHQDSSAVPSKLIFRTAAGRSVFGGGGIYPDIFVAADSLLLSPPFQNVLKSNAFIEYSMDFTERNRKDLEGYENADELLKDQQLAMKIRDGFMAYLIDNGIITEELDRSYDPAIQRQALAFVARNIWDDRSYHKVMNMNQAIIEKAMDILNNDKIIWEDLSINLE